MAVTLSPFPNSGTAARTAAVAYIQSQCAGRAAESTEAAEQLGELAAALVEREAPGAPQPVKNEAAVRMIGYLSQADFGAIRSETVGPYKQDYAMNHGQAFRRCSAAGLLSPWKVRRAGRIG